MSDLATWADIATIVVGVSALTSVILWGQLRWSTWRKARDARRFRNWSGYIAVDGIDFWYVRLVGEPEEWPSAKLTLEAVDRDGTTPNPNLANSLRRRVQIDGHLSRAPTPAQADFLFDLHKSRYKSPGGYPV